MSQRHALLLAVSAALAMSAFAPTAHAQPDLSRPVGPTLADRPSASHRFERFELSSADGQRRYRVQLAIPLGAAPAGGLPVLYLLDGNAAFAALREDDLAALATAGTPLALAAIGYATDLRFDTTARAYDYTPRVPGAAQTKDDSAHDRPAGGADVFLDLVEQQIQPAVRARMAVDASRESIWGHSYGGLLALHALFTRPAMFSTYIAAEPSLWWQQGLVLREEAQAVPLPAGPARRLLLINGRNAPERPPSGDAATQRMRQARQGAPEGAARELVARQAQRPGLRAALREIDGLGHGPMLAASLPDALRLAAGTQPP